MFVRSAPFAAERPTSAGHHHGIDMATRAELVGTDLDVDAICDFVGADSLHYISLDGLIDSTPDRRESLCTACFTGEYPIPVPGEHEQLAQIRFDFDAPATNV